MKKQTAYMFLSVSALLTLNAFAPQVLWHANKTNNRFPASSISEIAHQEITIDKDKLESLSDIKVQEQEMRLAEIKKEILTIDHDLLKNLPPIQVEEKEMKLAELKEEQLEINHDLLRRLPKTKEFSSITEIKHEDLKVDYSKLIEVIEIKPEERAMLLHEIKEEKLAINKALLEKSISPQVQCGKEAQPEDLEVKLQKLVADKESILKEIAELKKIRASKEPKESKFASKKKEAVKNEYASDSYRFMSELTGLMASQQQQQTMMMMQMFSMFAQSQPQQRQNDSIYGQYSFVPSRMEMSYSQQYPLGYSRHEIGIDFLPHRNEAPQFQHQDYGRNPSAQYEQYPMQRMQPQMQMQPQLQTQYPIAHEGFDFSGTTMSGFQRVQF
jgi:hypothetical protein